jgi:hypothetical protein
MHTLRENLAALHTFKQTSVSRCSSISLRGLYDSENLESILAFISMAVSQLA